MTNAELYTASTLNPGHDRELVAATGLILAHCDQYQAVMGRVRIPWLVIAAIHFRESGLRFDRHLHNGDPLTARTVHVPAGRPVDGSAPFAWVDSACDALSDRWKPVPWDLQGALTFLEHYNGTAYRVKHGIASPYVWSYTSAYTSGLYVADGEFDPNAVSEQAGCAALFKQLESQGLALDFSVPLASA